MDLHVADRLPSLENLAIERLDRVRHARGDHAKRTSDAGLDGSTVDVGEALVHSSVPQLAIDQGQSDRGGAVERLQLKELATRALLTLLQSHFDTQVILNIGGEYGSK